MRAVEMFATKAETFVMHGNFGPFQFGRYDAGYDGNMDLRPAVMKADDSLVVGLRGSPFSSVAEAKAYAEYLYYQQP